MRWNESRSTWSGVRIRTAAAVIGCGALATLAIATLLQTDAGEVVTAFRTGGSMQTGITTSERVAVTVATPIASPTAKATAHWGQPAEP